MSFGLFNNLERPCRERPFSYAARQNSTPSWVEVRQATRQARSVPAASNVKENRSGIESVLTVASRAPSEVSEPEHVSSGTPEFKVDVGHY
jgi:hypothetical protein